MRPPKFLLALLALLVLGVAASGCFNSSSTGLTITQAVTVGTGTAATVVNPGQGGGGTATNGGGTTTNGGGTTTNGGGTTTNGGGTTTNGGGKPAAQTLGVSGLPCSACHTMKDAGWSGNVGPNLDQAKPDFNLITDRVTNGKGAMPPFKGQFSAAQIKCIAAYVSAAAGASGQVTTDMKGNGAPSSIADACNGVKLGS
jgi:cytochrome c553